MLKNDLWLREHGDEILRPYHAISVKRESRGKSLTEAPVRVISYGTSSFGYDIRVADEWQVFDPNVQDSNIVDPKNFNPKLVREFKGDVCILPPHGFVLCRSLEYVTMPRDCLGICMGKSTYARCGLVVNITPLEPEWEGHITIEISNTTPLPVKVYANEGIAQLIFLQGQQPAISYKDRDGKYLGQTGITQPKV